MKKILSLLVAVLMLVGVASVTSSCKAPAEYTVGICQLAPHPALDAATQGFKDQLEKELGKGKIKFLEQNAAGDAATCNTIVADFTAKNVDLILANATASLQAAAEATDNIPILGTSITEYGVALNIDNFNGTVGGNISGTSDLAPLDQQAAMVKDLFPEAETVALLYCSAEPNSEYQVKKVREYLIELGYSNDNIKNYSFADINEANSVAALAATCDVIYVPTDNTVANCAPSVLGAIGDTPLIAGEEGICSGCGVATLSISYYDLGVATAKMAAKILRGEADISEMEIEYAATYTKKYNADRCKELNIDTKALEAKGYVAIATED